MLWLLLLIPALLIAIVCLGYKCFHDAFMKNKPIPYEKLSEKSKLAETAMQEALERLKSLGAQDVFIENRGLKLHAYWIDNHAENTVLLAHGHMSNAYSRAVDGEFYVRMGWNVLLIDHCAHGQSEGKYLGLGAYEKTDIIAWVRYIDGQIAGGNIVLDGVSMGATSVLLAAANDPPASVKAVVEDCGYTSIKAVLTYQIAHYYHLPSHLFLWVTDLLCRHYAKYRMKDASAIDAMPNVRVPVLFIHGERDHFVPFQMVQQLYDACVSPQKLLLSIPGAGHATARLVDKARCEQTIVQFLHDVGLKWPNDTSLGTENHV